MDYWQLMLVALFLTPDKNKTPVNLWKKSNEVGTSFCFEMV